jgi:hypothetical protein
MNLPIIIKNSRIPKLLSWVIDVYAITLWPFVFIRDEGNDRTVNHETIHIKQYNELLVVGFLLLYAYDWLHGMIKYRDRAVAYYRIRFEQEAYENDNNVHYINERQHYAWTKYSV